jgi:hypothetical protein
VTQIQISILASVIVSRSFSVRQCDNRVDLGRLVAQLHHHQSLAATYEMYFYSSKELVPCSRAIIAHAQYMGELQVIQCELYNRYKNPKISSIP